MSAFHSIFSGALSSLLHVHWSTVFSTTCVAAEHSTVPFTSSFNSKNIGVSAIHFICSGVLSSPLHVHCGPMLFATSALEHCPLHYMCTRALSSLLQCTGALSSPLQCTRAVSTILSTTVSP